MPDEKIGTQESPRWEYTDRKDGVLRVYTNNFRLDWTPHDVRINFAEMHHLADYQLLQKGERAMGVENHASVTMAWSEAKALRDALNDLVNNFEKHNGQIIQPKIP